MATVLRANLVFLVLVMLLAVLSFMLPLGMGPLTYLEPFTFSWFREDALMRGVANRHEIGPHLACIVVLIGYIVAGAVLQSLAFTRFDKRVSQAES